MDQAQGAIDAARAAGADRFATDSLRAATDALGLAHQAVDVRDFRLALNHALESREYAQTAAREAADTRARLRGEAERLVTEVGTLLAQVDKTVAGVARSQRNVVRAQQARIESAREDLQKASTAIDSGDYGGAASTLTGTKERIAAVINTLEETRTSQSTRRRP